MLNQLTAIKYASWESERGGFFTTARQMWKEGGVQPFMKGIVPTVLRDTIFGGVFAISKEGCTRTLKRIHNRATTPPPPHTHHHSQAGGGGGGGMEGVSETAEEVSTAVARSIASFSDAHVGTIDFLSSLIAGAAGTIVSSPFNFVRNIKYGWPASETPPTASVILGQLVDEMKTKRREEGVRSALAHMQERLRIGWGTARVAVGMAVGYEIYEVVKAHLDPPDAAHTPK